MKLCLINGGFDTPLRDPARLLDRYWHVRSLAEALAQGGHHVTVVQAFGEDLDVSRHNVAYRFRRVRGKHQEDWAEFGRGDDIAAMLTDCNPDVVHVFGMTMLFVCAEAGRWCKQTGAHCTVSYHGGQPGRNPYRRWFQRRALAHVAAFFISTPATADAWRQAGLVAPGANICVVPEVSSPFVRQAKRTARDALGIRGSPLLVWAGRLHESKDPLTAIKAFARVARAWPTACLAMAFQTDEMLSVIKSVLGTEADVRNRVNLLGRLEHEQMATLFSAADLFIHTSRREIGSNVLVEAMSCGAIPVVSNLPSLSALTAPISAAAKFEVGDDTALARRILAIDPGRVDQLCDRVQAEFAEFLAYPVLARQYEAAFKRIIGVATAASA